MRTIKTDIEQPWSTLIQAEVSTSATEIEITDADADAIAPMLNNEVIIITGVHGSNFEIMHIIAVNTSTNTITVERAKENTTALAYEEQDVLSARPTIGIFDFLVQKGGSSIFNYLQSKARIYDHGQKPDRNILLEEIAAQQSLTAAGNLTLTSSPVTMPDNIPRRVVLSSSDNNSGVTFTFTYNDENGYPQTSSAITGCTANKELEITDFWVSEVSQIAVSGACTNIEVGVKSSYNQEIIAETQTPTVSGILTLTDTQFEVFNGVPRKLTITSDSDCSSIYLTFTYKDENGSTQTSAPITGPNSETIYLDFWVTEVSQIDNSGACTNISVGVDAGLIVLDFENGEVQKLEVNAPYVINFDNIEVPDVENTMRLYLNRGGDYVSEFPTLKTDYGSAPVLSSKEDMLIFIMHSLTEGYITLGLRGAE